MSLVILRRLNLRGGGGGVSSKHIADIVRKVGNQIKVLQRHKNVIDVYVKMRL